MIDLIVNLPTWHIIRLLGIVSFVLLSLGMCLGIVYGYPMRNGKNKANIYKWHTFMNNAGTLIGLLHGIVTVIDTYVPFTWRDLLVPFSSAYEPLLSGLGTIAGYGAIVLLFTSDFRHKMSKKIWLGIHMLSYPIFVMAVAHGFFEGTDSTLPGIQAMYGLSIAAIVCLTVVRVFVGSDGKKANAARRLRQPHAGG